jgi:hypothetical protein
VSEFIQNIPLYFNGITKVKAELYEGYSTVFLECWLTVWSPAQKEYLCQGTKIPEHAHWNWIKKVLFAAKEGIKDNFFWIQHNNITQGIMLVEQSISVFEQNLGEKNIYVHFIEIAPWNFNKDTTRGYYKGVGTNLLMAAIQLSDELGFGGRIALESLPQSENFYRAKGMVPVEKQGSQSGLQYFELPTQKAQDMLKRRQK